MAKETKEDTFDEFREHSRAAARAFGDSWKAFIPEGFIEKGKESQREALLAVRSLLDVAIDKLETQPAGKKKVKVEAE